MNPLQDTGIWSPVGTSPTCSIDADGLEPGHQYKFRVRAVNPEGESDNLESLKPITAKDPFGPPMPPSAPDIVDWSENHMDLEWKEPIDDGGAQVTGYHVEAREGETDNSMARIQTAEIRLRVHF